MIEQTCPRCNYQRSFCQCGRKRNTSGDVVRFSSYEDYTKEDNDYARTARPYRASAEERKFMEEFLPIDNEEYGTYIIRTNEAVKGLIEYAVHRHLYGTSKTWPCHTQSRYCPVCQFAQQCQIHRQLMVSHLNTHPKFYKDRIRIQKKYDRDGILESTSMHIDPHQPDPE